MLKIRIEGKQEEILECLGFFRQDPNYEVCNISKTYENRNQTSKYRRCYIEVEIKHPEEGDQ